jgi:hypothetical protein
MTDHGLRCTDFEAHLPDFLDGGLAEETRDACEAHRQRCPLCAALVADLDALVTAAESLPLPAPSRDLWPAIEARLATPVQALDVARPRAAIRPIIVWQRLAVAAALLVTVSAGVTWQVARQTAPTGDVIVLAAEREASAGTAQRRGSVDDAPAASPASADLAAASGRADAAPLTFTSANTRAAALDTLYGRAIARLQAAVDDNLGRLDASTVDVVRRNLAIIDQAIRESRDALAADPNSGFLFEQLDRAYESKVDLLRRLATL